MPSDRLDGATHPQGRAIGRGSRSRFCAPRTLVLASLAIVVVGVLGLDRPFYVRVSRALNTEDRPLDRDFYSLTKPFWLAWRYAFGHALGAAAVIGLVTVRERRGWRVAAAGLFAVLLAGGLANVAQHAIGRLRPNQASSHLAFTSPVFGLMASHRVSFPSGEAATAFALSCVLSGMFPRWRGAYFGAAGLTAFSRLVNGAHYLSDVAAGALLGVIVAQAVAFGCGLGRGEAGAAKRAGQKVASDDRL